MQVGNWVQYSTNRDFSKWGSEHKEIYQKNQCFLVIAEYTPIFDQNFDLIDMKGNIHNYCPRMRMLGLVDLQSDYKITKVSKKTVESIHGADKVQSVYEAAQKFIVRTKGSSVLLHTKEVLNGPKLFTFEAQALKFLVEKVNTSYTELPELFLQHDINDSYYEPFIIRIFSIGTPQEVWDKVRIIATQLIRSGDSNHLAAKKFHAMIVKYCRDEREENSKLLSKYIQVKDLVTLILQYAPIELISMPDEVKKVFNQLEITA